ncbi:MAG TPA: hypothetical protein ENJ64_02015, partial [Thiotrichales bacterium]|nr:hypothetical protein [Thiotrichales bacterium]
MKSNTLSSLIKAAFPAVKQTFILSFLLVYAGLQEPVYGAEYYGIGSITLDDVLVDGHGTGSLHEHINRNSGVVIATAIGDDDTVLGPKGEFARAAYYGNLATGQVGAVVQAVNSYDHNDDTWGETQASTWVQMVDTLYFTVPAGTYEDGVSVIAKGFVRGSMADSSWGQSRFSFAATLGMDQYVLQDSGDSTVSHSVIVDNVFTLSNTLVQPGTTLNSDLTIRRAFTISLGGPATLLASTYGNKTGLKQATSARVDFY